MTSPDQAARAFVESLPSRPSGDLSHAVPVRTADLVPALAALIHAERRAAVEMCARKVERENLYGLAAALRALPLD